MGNARHVPQPKLARVICCANGWSPEGTIATTPAKGPVLKVRTQAEGKGATPQRAQPSRLRRL